MVSVPDVAVASGVQAPPRVLQSAFAERRVRVESDCVFRLLLCGDGAWKGGSAVVMAVGFHLAQ